MEIDSGPTEIQQWILVIDSFERRKRINKRAKLKVSDTHSKEFFEVARLKDSDKKNYNGEFDPGSG